MTDVTQGPSLPPQIMGTDSVGWWSKSAMTEGTGGIAAARNRVRIPNRDVRNVGNLVQANPAIRPVRTISTLTFSLDHLVSQSGIIIEVGELPEMWVVAEILAPPLAQPNDGLFEVYRQGQTLTQRGMGVEFNRSTNLFRAFFSFANGFTSVASFSRPSAGLHLFRCKALATRVSLRIGAETVLGTDGGSGGSEFDLDYTAMGGFGVSSTLVGWTGRLEEMFLAKANASTAQELEMTQYFSGLYPGIKT